MNNKNINDDFLLNPLVQSDREIIDYAIIGEFLRMEKALRTTTSNLHIFFSTPQNDLKKITNQNDHGMHLWKKIKVFGALLNIIISTYVQSTT